MPVMALPGLAIDLVDAVFRPSSLVQAQVDSYTDNRIEQLFVAGYLSAVYLLNLLLYAGPLTLAGFGESAMAVAPGPLALAFLSLFVPDPAAVVDFAVRLVVNSSFIFIASILVFGTFQLGLWITRSSQGLLQSIHTVTYSVGIYLAGIFTLVWYLSRAESVVIADEALISLQKSYIYLFIDLLEVPVGLPTGRPDPVDYAVMTRTGQLALGGLLLTLGYFLYSLYLGARINHHASRLESFIAVATVFVAPAAYVIGSIVITVFLEPTGPLALLLA